MLQLAETEERPEPLNLPGPAEVQKPVRRAMLQQTDRLDQSSGAVLPSNDETTG